MKAVEHMPDKRKARQLEVRLLVVALTELKSVEEALRGAPPEGIVYDEALYNDIGTLKS